MTPTPAMRNFLVHMQECEGWDEVDPVRVHRATLEAAERLGWARLERAEDGTPYTASITPSGREAYRWDP